jgi:hypothetical protein
MQVQAKVERNGFPVTEACSVRILVRADEPLVPGDTVELQLPNSWLVRDGPSFTRDVQVARPEAPHYLAIDAPGTDAVFAVEIRERNLPWVEGDVRHGRHVVGTLVSGSVPRGHEIRLRYENTVAPYIASVEPVWVRVKGSSPEEQPVLVSTPGPHARLRVLVPSWARPGLPFTVLVVSLDRRDNLTHQRFEGKALRMEGSSWVRPGLDFEGSVRIPVVLSTEGVYRFLMDDVLSNAVRVGSGPAGPFWGDLHIHTQLSSDGQGPDPYPYARDVSGLDFAAAADHCTSMGPIGFEVTRGWAARHDEPGRFAVVVAYECDGRGHPGGHHNAYFRDKGRLFADAIDPASGALGGVSHDIARVWPLLDPSTTITIPHHTGIAFTRDVSPGGFGHAVDPSWGDDRGMRPVMEIYSHHGQSERYDPCHLLAYEVNRMRNPERRSNTSVPGPFYAQDWWMRGFRFGVIGSSDEHSGQGGRSHGWLAAVFAEGLSREAVFDALKARRCYATTGERILLEFQVDGVEMGQSAARPRGSRLHIGLRVWATELIVRVDVLRFRFGVDQAFLPILSAAPRPESRDASFDLEDEVTAGSVYYARVLQQPLEWPGMAWSSPVWIDTTP